MITARKPPFKMAWDETGGYDCMTPAILITDTDGDLVCVVDTKDYGMVGSNADAVRDEYARRATFDTAKLIVDAVNRCI